MRTTRLASVAYLNALPLTWGLSHGASSDSHTRYALTYTSPAECALLLREGLVDIALIPSIEFARTGGLLHVPGTGVTSRNEVRSVLLISRTKPESIRSLAVDANSRTSVALARLVLRHRYGCRPPMLPMPPDLDAMLQEHDAALLIGDAALRASLEAPWPGRHVLDLAREWNEMTGMPFVFAFWACRPVVDVARTRVALDRSLDEGLQNIDRIASEESHRTGLPVSVITSYLRHNIQFRLGQPESNSLRVFYRLAREESLLGGAEPVTASSAAGAPSPATRPPGTAGGTGSPSRRLPHPPPDR